MQGDTLSLQIIESPVSWISLNDTVDLRAAPLNELLPIAQGTVLIDSVQQLWTEAVQSSIPPHGKYYIYDHLQNTRVVYHIVCAPPNTSPPFRRELDQVLDYYPFGKILRQYTAPDKGVKYKSTAHSLSRVNGKRDLETDFDYRIARYYSLSRNSGNSEIGRFLSVDPMAHERSWLTPYNYVQNNPLNRIDPTGALDWKPDEDGNLIAEKDDNATTLAKNYGYTVKEAQAFIDKSNVKLDKNGNVQEGQKVEVENRFTQAIKSQILGEGGYEINGKLSNCHGATCDNGGFLFEGGFDHHLLNSYEPVNESEVIPQETVVRFGGRIDGFGQYGNNLAIHSATAYGKSKNGSLFVFTVNGFGQKAQVQNLNDVKIMYNHAQIKGVKFGDSGYYNLR